MTQINLSADKTTVEIGLVNINPGLE